MELLTVKIEKPEEINVVIGMSHFIKTVEDIHEAMVGSVPGIKFGLAFCEASGDCLVRLSGTDDAMVALARKNAEAVGAGHTFFIFMKDVFPINILNAIKAVPEVCSILCATANPVEAVIVDNGEGRGILGVIDGFKPRGVEGDEGREWRHGLLRKIGYKL